MDEDEEEKNHVISLTGIIRLNIGGHLFVTTKSTLLSRGENFFTPLLNGKLNSHKDESGAFFIDRNGKYFEPILDFLRHGDLVVPTDLSLSLVLKEANFYSIDITPGLVNVQEGLYTSSNWILFLERDSNHPWMFGVTGVEDDKSTGNKEVFFKQLCIVKDGAIHWNYNNVTYQIYSMDSGVYIWNPEVFKSNSQLYPRCPKSPKFPLEMNSVLSSDERFTNSPIEITFDTFPQGVIGAKINHPSFEQSDQDIEVEVLCRRLFIMHVQNRSNEDQCDWLLYLHSDLACFAFGHPKIPFGGSFNLKHKN